jgi:hypothetical protein
MKQAEGPYFVLAFAPAPFLKNINNNEERIEARAQYVEEINTEVANNGGIYNLSDELQHLESSSSSSSSSSKVSLPLVMALPQSIGSFALALAASMQCTIFGGSTCSYDENTEVNKTSVQSLPFTFLHSEQELEDLARGGGVDTTNGNGGISSSISNSSAIPLSLSALNQALQLGGVNNLSSMRSKFIKKVFQNNGTVYYTASMNNHFMSSSSKLSKMKLSELDGKQLSVLNLQLIVNQITLSVITCMKNGSQLVPCLVLGDEQFGTSLSSSTLLDMATPFNQGLRTSTSLFSAFKLALFSLVKKTELAPKPSPLAVVYGAPISLPYTSNPNPLVIQEFVDEYLNSLSELETKYSHLHSAH